MPSRCSLGSSPAVGGPIARPTDRDPTAFFTCRGPRGCQRCAATPHCSVSLRCLRAAAADGAAPSSPPHPLPSTALASAGHFSTRRHRLTRSGRRLVLQTCFTRSSISRKFFPPRQLLLLHETLRRGAATRGLFLLYCGVGAWRRRRASSRPPASRARSPRCTPGRCRPMSSHVEGEEVPRAAAAGGRASRCRKERITRHAPRITRRRCAAPAAGRR